MKRARAIVLPLVSPVVMPVAGGVDRQGPPVTGGFLLTEGGDFLVTEAGDKLVTENG